MKVCILIALAITTVASAQNLSDTIGIEYRHGELNPDYGYYYLSKNGKEVRASSYVSWMFKINKKAFLQMIDDVPELYDYSKKNLFYARYQFAFDLVECYNDYKLSGGTKLLNDDYFHQFGLLTRKEYRKGPSHKVLSEKKPIKGDIFHLRTVTTHQQNHLDNHSTVADNFKFKFMYGDLQYKGKKLLGNLKNAVGDNEEALGYIKKYRTRFIARTSIFSIGLVQAGLAISWWVTDNPPFGMSTAAGIAVLAPGVIFLNWANIFPQKYKTKFITKAIESYNSKL